MVFRKTLCGPSIEEKNPREWRKYTAPLKRPETPSNPLTRTEQVGGTAPDDMPWRRGPLQELLQKRPGGLVMHGMVGQPSGSLRRIGRTATARLQVADCLLQGDILAHESALPPPVDHIHMGIDLHQTGHWISPCTRSETAQTAITGSGQTTDKTRLRDPVPGRDQHWHRPTTKELLQVPAAR